MASTSAGAHRAASRPDAGSPARPPTPCPPAVTAARPGALRARERDEVVGLLAETAALTGVELPTDADRLADHRAARRALTVAWERTLDAMAAPDGGPSARTSDLIGLLRRIKSADETVLRRDAERHDELFRRVREGLQTVSEIETTSALVALAPEAICALGFDRAIISRVEDSLWIPENVAIERDPSWAEQILEAGRADPLALSTPLPETEILRRRISLLVDNVQQRASVHRPIADASLSRSYAASPLVAGGEVVGLLHADCYYQPRDLDDSDRHVLAAFAEGLGQALARTMILDQVGALRGQLESLTGQLSTAALTGSWHPRAVAGATANGAPARRGADAGPSPTLLRAELTRREIEVLQHMAAGDTNARTARRLVISEGTVKSHVKHILRKLGAANRAEAVSLWWRMENER